MSRAGRAGRAGRPRKGRVQVSVHLPPDIVTRLDALADAQARSRSDVICDLVSAGLDAAEGATRQLPDFSEVG